MRACVYVRACVRALPCMCVLVCARVFACVCLLFVVVAAVAFVHLFVFLLIKPTVSIRSELSQFVIRQHLAGVLNIHCYITHDT